MAAVYQDRQFFGHPKGLGVLGSGNLFNSIAWAAFNAIFIYYLYTPFSKGLGFSQGQASSIIAAMGVANSVFGIVGSWLADRVLGMQKALVWGNVTKALGFAMMAIPAITMNQGRIFMFIGLILLCVPLMGSSNASLTAQLYRKSDDARRDAAFNVHNIFNSIGGLLAPVIVGNISTKNYHIGFAIAAVAALGYAGIILIFGHKFFGDLGLKPVKPLTKREGTTVLKWSGLVAAVLLVAFGVALGTHSLTFDRLLNLITTMAFLIPLAFFTKMFTNKAISKHERRVFKPMGKLLAIQVFQAVIWALTGPATLMYMDQKLNRTVGGFTFAPATFVSIGAAFALIFNPVATYLWTATKFGSRIHSLSKMALSYILGSVTLFVIPLTIFLATGKVNPLWYILTMLVDNFTGAVGGPSGISLMAKMAPKSYDTQIQTAWSQCTTIGNGIGRLVFMVFNTVDKQLTLFPFLGVGSVLVGIYLYATRSKLEAAMA